MFFPIASAAAGGALIAGGAAPSAIQIDYCAVTDTANVDPFAATFTMPTPIAGQKFYFMDISEEFFNGTPSIGGSTSGVTVLDSDTYSTTDRIYLVEKTGWEVGTSLAVNFDMVAAAAWFVIHGWRTVGLDYVAASFNTGGQTASNTTSTVLATTKAAGDVTFIATRKYSSVTGSTMTQDVAAQVWAGRLMDAGAFSGNLTATTATSSTHKFLATFNMTPSA